MVDARMCCKRSTSLRTETCDNVQSTRRQAIFGKNGSHAQQRQAGVLGRLHDAGIACCQSGGNTATEDLQRVIPGHDMTRDTVRLTQGHHCEFLRIWNGLAMELVDGACIKLEITSDG